MIDDLKNFLTRTIQEGLSKFPNQKMASYDKKMKEVFRMDNLKDLLVFKRRNQSKMDHDNDKKNDDDEDDKKDAGVEKDDDDNEKKDDDDGGNEKKDDEDKMDEGEADEDEGGSDDDNTDESGAGADDEDVDDESENNDEQENEEETNNEAEIDDDQENKADGDDEADKDDDDENNEESDDDSETTDKEYHIGSPDPIEEEAVDDAAEENASLTQWFEINVDEVVECCEILSLLNVPTISQSLPLLPVHDKYAFVNFTPPTFHLLTQEDVVENEEYTDVVKVLEKAGLESSP